MNSVNIFGVVISQFGFTYGALSSYAQAGLGNIYLGYGIWIVGIILLCYEGKER